MCIHIRFLKKSTTTTTNNNNAIINDKKKKKKEGENRSSIEEEHRPSLIFNCALLRSFSFFFFGGGGCVTWLLIDVLSLSLALFFSLPPSLTHPLIFLFSSRPKKGLLLPKLYLPLFKTTTRSPLSFLFPLLASISTFLFFLFFFFFFFFVLPT